MPTQVVLTTEALILYEASRYALATLDVLYRSARLAGLLVLAVFAAFIALIILSPQLEAAWESESSKAHRQEKGLVDAHLKNGSCNRLKVSLSPAERQESERFLTAFSQVVDNLDHPGTARLYGTVEQTRRDFESCP